MAKLNIFPYLLSSSGLSQREAAEYLDVRESSVSNWVLGRRKCPDEILKWMAQLVHMQGMSADLCTLDDIMSDPESHQISVIRRVIEREIKSILEGL